MLSLYPILFKVTGVKKLYIKRYTKNIYKYIYKYKNIKKIYKYNTLWKIYILLKNVTHKNKYEGKLEIKQAKCAPKPTLLHPPRPCTLTSNKGPILLLSRYDWILDCCGDAMETRRTPPLRLDARRTLCAQCNYSILLWRPCVHRPPTTARRRAHVQAERHTQHLSREPTSCAPIGCECWLRPLRPTPSVHIYWGGPTKIMLMMIGILWL